MKLLMTMRDALEHRDIFGKVFAGPSWNVWRIILIATMGEELTPSERITFTALTSIVYEPGKRVDELWAIVGRRGGKTRAIAVLAVYLAVLVDFSDKLAPGERASLPILSASLWQAGKARQYISGVFASVPALKKLVTNETSDVISLSNRIDIECRPASFRTIRGGTFIACICDEVAFWRSDESANPDVQIIGAVRPSLATTGGMLVCISSPYARSGELFEAFRRHYGGQGDQDILVVKGSTQTFNSTLNPKVIERAYANDPIAAATEYGGEFRSDVDAFVNADVVAAAICYGRHELLPLDDVSYSAFCDAAGGSGADAFTVCIAHRGEDDSGIVDLIREYRPPFSPAGVVKEIATILESYEINRIVGDRYAGSWPAERFSECGVRYEPSERTKSQIYVDALPLFNSGKVELLDNRKLVTQLCGLERRVGRGTGRDSIDHGPSGHDDIANAVCGALVLVANGMDRSRVWELL